VRIRPYCGSPSAVSHSRLPLSAAAGAKGVAVVRAILEAEDPEVACQLRSLLSTSRWPRTGGGVVGCA
jgi:hypothetical protein